jgi:hypothetical protein
MADADDCFREAQALLLNSIRKLDAQSPVAADFVKRGIPPRIKLSIHKVIFYGDRPK